MNWSWLQTVLPRGFRGRLVWFYLVLFLFVVPFTFSKIIAPDLFKALYTGRYLGFFLEIPHHSEFTFSPVKEFFPAESFNWLVNLFYYGLHQLGGIPLLQLFRVFVAVFMVVMLHAMVRFRSNPLILLILVAALFGAHQKFLVRNALFLIPFTVLLMWLWQQIRVRGRDYWWAGMPVLFLFWGSMHGTYLVGLGLLGLMVLGDGLDWLFRREHPGWKVPLKGGLVILLLVPVVMFAKPLPDYTLWDVGSGIVERGGKGMVSGLFHGEEGGGEDPSGETPKVKEDNDKQSSDERAVTGRSWRMQLYFQVRQFLQNTVFDTDRPSAAGKNFPLDPNRAYMFTAIGVLLIIVALGSFAVTARWFRFSEFLPFIAASVIGLGYVRTVALIPLVTVPILFIKYDRGDFDHLDMGQLSQVVSVLVLTLLFAHMSYHMWSSRMQTFTNSFLHFRWGLAERFSNRVPEYVKKRYPDTQMYNQYVLGTYLIWKWWPEKKVFVDGKSLAYDAEFMKKVFYNNHDSIADHYDLSFMVLPLRRDSIFHRFIPHPDWSVEAYDDGMILFRRVDDVEGALEDGMDPLLYTEEELRNLPESKRLFLMAVAGFLEHYHNNEEAMGDFTSPFQRYNHHIEELREELELPDSKIETPRAP